jgi:hypothetical protein
MIKTRIPMRSVQQERKPRRLRFEWEKALGKSHLPAGARAAGRALAEFANSTTGGNCHPGIDKLAEKVGVDRRTIIRNLAILRDQGWIERTARGGAGPGRGHAGKSGTADTYRLVIPSAERHQDVSGCRYCRAEAARKPVTSVQETSDIPAENQGHDVTPSVRAIRKREHSDSLSRPALAPLSAGDHDTTIDSDPADLCAVEDELEAKLGLDLAELSTVDGMLQRGAHPLAAVNKIRKGRADWSAAEAG